MCVLYRDGPEFPQGVPNPLSEREGGPVRNHLCFSWIPGTLHGVEGSHRSCRKAERVLSECQCLCGLSERGPVTEPIRREPALCEGCIGWPI